MIHVRQIPERIVSGRRLGRHVQHDPRSKDYQVAHATALIRSARWKRHAPAFDQGDLGECTAAATWGLLVTEPFFVPGRVPTPEDIEKLYSAATRLDRLPGFWPPTDTGSSGLAAMHAASQAGLLDGYHHALTFAATLAALQRGPVITGVNWYDGFDTPRGDAALIEIAGEVRGGHEVVITELDVENSLVRGCNSWSEDWGDDGMFTMSFETWQRLLKEEGDVTVGVRKAT